MILLIRNMLSVLRSARAVQPSGLSGWLPAKQNPICRKPCGIRFASQDNMDPKQDPKSKTTDTMSSFGEGYSTRSDEEGFGGIHGRNQSSSIDNNEENPSATEFDETQGSEVKEKERARHQTKIAS